MIGNGKLDTSIRSAAAMLCVTVLNIAGVASQGLLSLGRVIKGLVEKQSYIPYRDSKLTVSALYVNPTSAIA